MPIKTRGSVALGKAQRRLALLKSIDENLDLGNGLSIEAYIQMIEKNRTTLENHNTLLSEIEESRKMVIQLDKILSDLSGRMLSGIAVRYGRDSIQYAKAGGSNRKRRSKAVMQEAASTGLSSV